MNQKIQILTIVVLLTFLSSCGPPNIARMEENQDTSGLIEALNHEDPLVVVEAIEALGRIKYTKGAPTLNRLLGKGNPQSIELAVIAALAEIKDPYSIERLMYALELNDAEVRAAAHEDLVQLGGLAYSVLVEYLMNSDLEDADTLIINGIIDVLAEMGSQVPEAQNALLQTIRNGPIHVRAFIAEALEASGWQPGQDEESAYYYIAKQEWEECARIGAPAIDPLLSAFNEKKLYHLQEDVFYSISLIQDPLAIDPLMTILESSSDQEYELRNAILTAIEQISQPLMSELEPILSTLAPICEQEDSAAIPNLIEAIPEQFYPLVVLNEEGHVNNWTPVFFQREEPTTPGENRVIACMSQGYYKIETCHYTGGEYTPIDRFQTQYEITLEEAIFGEKITSEVFNGFPIECPLTFKEFNTYDWYGVVQIDELYSWLDEYLP